MSKRYQQLFTTLKQRRQGAFIPFVVLGDPTPELSLAIIDTLVSAGADALELGIPFSDPLADGPVIQNATLRAFSAKVTVSLCFDLLSSIRQKYPDLPIGLLMYANLIYRQGIDNFYQHCQQTDIDSVLIADVPIEESAPFHHSALQHDIAPVFICPPNADDALLQKIARLGQGYTYLLSRAGVTGTEMRAQSPLKHLIKKLADYQAPPPLQGFGISETKQVQEAINAGAAGAISGSAIVRIIEQHQHDPMMLLDKLSQFVSAMKKATHY